MNEKKNDLEEFEELRDTLNFNDYHWEVRKKQILNPEKEPTKEELEKFVQGYEERSENK